MEKKILISVVIPVDYGWEKPEGCLSSLRNQTLQQIEIILACDKNLTEETMRKIRAAAAPDPRTRIIFRDSSGNSSAATGAGASRGQFILFLKSEDRLIPSACDVLYRRMKKSGCGMLHFSIEPAEKEKKIRGNLLKACFEKDSFQPELFHTVLPGETVRKMANIESGDGFPAAQEAFLLFLVLSEIQNGLEPGAEMGSLYSRDHEGAETSYLTKEELHKNGIQLKISERFRAFLREEKKNDQYESAADSLVRILIGDSLKRLCMRAYRKDRMDGLNEMLKHISTEKLVQGMAQEYYLREEEVLDLATLLIGKTEKPRSIQTVGAFYPRLKNGGVQRVMAQLAGIWSGAGYRVVILTEEEQTDEYILPEGTVRRCLSPFDGLGTERKNKIADRIYQISQIIQEEKIDLLVYHQWLSDSILWDLMAVKIGGALFGIYCHNVFSIPLVEKMMHAYKTMPEIYPLADGVIVLSETDKTYWSQYCSRVFLVVNPLPFEQMRKEPANLKNHKVLWVGRFSKEKRPEDAIEVMRWVCGEVPDAELIMVGGNNPEAETSLREMAAEAGIENKIRFTGFQRDVDPYYQEASVFLMTSEYEGFSLVICEAQLRGLPVVGYNLFYLSVLETGKGSILAPIGKTAEIAEGIIHLFQSPEEYARLSKEALENMARLNINLEERWRDIFGAMLQEKTEPEQNTTLRTVLDTIRQQATMREPRLIQTESNYILDAAIPYPERGPFRRMRRKMALMIRIVLIDGFQGIRKNLGRKKSNHSKNLGTGEEAESEDRKEGNKG